MAFFLAALGGGLQSCAYFNTFYEAKRHYSKAERLQRESRSDKLNTEATRSYDAAIEKCVKVIVEHGGGWKAGIDDALFLMGACYYGKREYETAIKKFNELMLNYPDSEHVPEALFYTGLCYHRTRNYGTAQRVFERVMRDYPDHERRDEILFITAKGLEAEGQEDRALRQYRRLRDDFRDSDRREEALEHIGDIYFSRGVYDSALIAFENLAETTRDDDLYFEAQLDVGACLVRLGDYDRAVNIYTNILPENAARNEQGGRVWLAMAEAENRRKRHNKALEHLTQVSKNFANRGLGLEADFRMGYTYEVYLLDYEKAREAYETAARSRQRSVFKEQANRRLQNLSYLEELQSSLDGEDTAAAQGAEAALKVAEFALFESDDPEGALEHYQEVIRGFPTSEAATRAAYARAWIHQSRTDSIEVAAREFEALVERYPSSPQAERALVHLSDLGIADERRTTLGYLVRSAREREQRLTDSLAVIDSLAAADSMAVVADSLAMVADSLAAVAEQAAEAMPDTLAADQEPHTAASIDSTLQRPEEARVPPASSPMSQRALQGGGRSRAERDSILMGTAAGRLPRPPDGIRRGIDSRMVPDSVRGGMDSVRVGGDSAPGGVDSILAPVDTTLIPLTPGEAAPDTLPAPPNKESL